MPVLIKKNEATECCITNGAEARVVSWHIDHSIGTPILATLFVELINPPRPVQLRDLPLNVVPLTRHTVNIECKMPNDKIELVTWQQIPVLPNFAMTDYASQGRTRPNNVVDLNNCSSHQSYYTTLSRSASAAGTIIVQGFDPRKIMGGASGYLRQEFRELEILDDITKLKFNGLLPGHIQGHRRNTLVRAYQHWKKDECPKHVHAAIKWSKADPLDTIEYTEDAKWEILSGNSRKLKATKKIPTDEPPKAEPANEVMSSKIPGAVNSGQTEPRLNSTGINSSSNSQPVGFIWSSLYSCAYDALLTIVYNLWSENKEKWSNKLKINDNMTSLISSFLEIVQEDVTMEMGRDQLRANLNSLDRSWFPLRRGQGTGISDLCEELMKSTSIGSTTSKCDICGRESVRQMENLSFDCLNLDRDENLTGTDSTITKWLETYLNPEGIESGRICCRQKQIITNRLTNLPCLMAFNIASANIALNKSFSLRLRNNRKYHLTGIIYFGNYHFNCRFIDKKGNIWYNDGMETGRECRLDGNLSNVSLSDLNICRGKNIATVIYAQRY
ncbi:hypothetical protein NEOLEDRAFT_1069101 [Neolentinus lepideus HHB14362 ss-1]|uniref:Uncharacterized protein n=1 Tax=Neolentinus lepideus HHB14362 ss-1 TaxID=1314782 RepID=A0A165RCE8_9AGAM|nr:hypothetical protein NEOLEDRAFT_1069101 [Neolentinus lepideus HHB14362 ss-1]